MSTATTGLPTFAPREVFPWRGDRPTRVAEGKSAIHLMRARDGAGRLLVTNMVTMILADLLDDAVAHDDEQGLPGYYDPRVASWSKEPVAWSATAEPAADSVWSASSLCRLLRAGFSVRQAEPRSSVVRVSDARDFPHHLFLPLAGEDDPVHVGVLMPQRFRERREPTSGVLGHGHILWSEAPGVLAKVNRPGVVSNTAWVDAVNAARA